MLLLLLSLLIGVFVAFLIFLSLKLSKGFLYMHVSCTTIIIICVHCLDCTVTEKNILRFFRNLNITNTT